ncbi:unnamed protein product [Calicophoron daubneyi]|uniref:Uncharacterized protein n=1 Tax=Calicophoron daubneyi TaxID=300641 RepID=A0AAV2TWZ8_CALDB
MMSANNNLLEYDLSPYETTLNGLPPRQSAKLFNTHGSGTMSDLVDFKLEAMRCRKYNEARRTQPWIRRQDELNSQLYRDELNFARRLGKFIEEHNRAVYNAWVKMSHS